MADAYESVLCVKNEVFVYKIPPRPSNRGYKASDWKLDAPDWTGRLRVVAVNKDLFIKLEDKISGELFAQCPVDEYPGVAVEQVMDSSRYFVLRIKDPSGRSAFIGVGFADRSDSFDLNVSIQDHFKWLKQEQEAQKATKDLSAGPKLDLGFKEGQTITLNIGSKSGVARTKPKPRAAGEIGLLPPPPGSSGGGIKLPPPSGGGGAGIIPPPSGASSGFVSAPSPSKPAPASNSAKSVSSDLDFLLDLGPGDMGAPPSLAPAQPAAQNQAQGSTDFWGDFASAGSTSSTPASANNNNNNNNSGGPWVQF